MQNCKLVFANSALNTNLSSETPSEESQLIYLLRLRLRLRLRKYGGSHVTGDPYVRRVYKTRKNKKTIRYNVKTKHY
jgi:hypothetical protein